MGERTDIEMNFFLLSVLYLSWFGRQAESLTGCLQTAGVCSKPNQICVNFGGFGMCVDSDLLPGKPLTKAAANQKEQYPFLVDNKQQQQKQQQTVLKRASPDGSKQQGSTAASNSLLKQFVLYLISNGIDIRGMSDKQLHDLVRKFIYKSSKEKQEWPRRLISSVLAARRMLNKNGISLADLSERDLSDLSHIIAETFVKQEKVSGTRYGAAAAAA